MRPTVALSVIAVGVAAGMITAINHLNAEPTTRDVMDACFERIIAKIEENPQDVSGPKWDVASVNGLDEPDQLGMCLVSSSMDEFNIPHYHIEATTARGALALEVKNGTRTLLLTDANDYASTYAIGVTSQKDKPDLYTATLQGAPATVTNDLAAADARYMEDKLQLIRGLRGVALAKSVRPQPAPRS